MRVYIVTYTESFPGAGEYTEDELTGVAFVLARSFQEANEKVEKRFKKEQESVFVKAISIDDKATIIV